MCRGPHKNIVSFPPIAGFVLLHIVVVVPRLGLDFRLQHVLRVA